MILVKQSPTTWDGSPTSGFAILIIQTPPLQAPLDTTHTLFALMGRPFDTEIPLSGPYKPKLGKRPIAQPIPAIVAGRNAWCYDEYVEAWLGMGSSVASMNAGLIVPLGSDAIPGGVGSGTILVWRGDSTWFIGSGSAYRNSSTPIGTASSALQFLLSAVLYTAGLAQPSAPTLRLTNESNKKPRGTYSLKITQVRPTTGEESNASLATNIVTATGQRLLIDMTGIATPSDGKRWAAYGSDGGYSQKGPWLFRLEFDSSQLGTVTDSGSVGRANSIAIEYYDFDTSLILAPFDFAPPPAGTHLTTLGSVVTVLGSYSGAGVSPSLAGRLGWPATFTRFLNPAEPIVRVDGRPGNGWQAVFTKQSVQSIILSGDETGPVFVRSMWPTVGIHNESAACMIESEIYAVSGDGYLVRSSGHENPDTSWANDVRPDVKNIDPTTAVVGYDPKNDVVCVMDGQTCHTFMRGRNEWSTPFDLPGVNAESAATVAGKLYVKFSDGSVRAFDNGNGSGISGKARSAFYSLGNIRHRKSVFGFETVAKDGGTTNLYGNLDATTVLASQVDGVSSDHHAPQVKDNVKKLKSFSFERSGIPAGGRAELVAVHGAIDETYIDL